MTPNHPRHWVWKSKDRTKKSLAEMDNGHLVNTRNMLLRQLKESPEFNEASAIVGGAFMRHEKLAREWRWGWVILIEEELRYRGKPDTAAGDEVPAARDNTGL